MVPRGLISIHTCFTNVIISSRDKYIHSKELCWQVRGTRELSFLLQFRVPWTVKLDYCLRACRICLGIFMSCVAILMHTGNVDWSLHIRRCDSAQRSPSAWLPYPTNQQIRHAVWQPLSKVFSCYTCLSLTLDISGSAIEIYMGSRKYPV